MECARLGHSGIEVSSLCLGDMSFGEASPRFHQWTIGPQETRAGKAPALGASEAYAYQLHNLQDVAAREGFTKFTSMQCHYNLLYREDEREMIPVCRQFDMALMPYSPMASGHLCRLTWDTDSKRSETDSTMVNKYGGAREEDLPIIACAAEVAARHEVPMARVALGQGVESPIVGCSTPERVDDAVAALDVALTPEEIDYLEEPYRSHELVGPKPRPGEKPLAGTTKVNLTK